MLGKGVGSRVLLFLFYFEKLVSPQLATLRLNLCADTGLLVAFENLLTGICQLKKHATEGKQYVCDHTILIPANFSCL